MPPLLEMQGIVKDFPGVRALSGVDFTLSSGEVHCLVGENGAGKSTLIRILAGALRPDGGRMLLDGEPAEIRTPADALARGISVIHQDLMLVPHLTVAENIMLGAEPRIPRTPLLDTASLRRAAREVLDLLEEEIDPDAPVAELSPGRRQIVAMARALNRNARILVLDEPSAALTEHEIGTLFRIIGRLRERGVGVIYISHRLEEVFRIGDRVTVLRDGAVIRTIAGTEARRPQLISWMVGRETPEGPGPRTGPPGEELLSVDRLGGGSIREVSFAVRAGEVFGLAGLIGSGRSEVARLIFGADIRETGRMWIDGTETHPRSPREAIDAGIGLLTEDRNRLGLLLQMNVRENISLAILPALERGPLIDRKKEEALANDCVHRLRIRTPSTEIGVDALSGGNRQKVVLARWLSTESRLLIFDEPTAGVDVGAKSEIHTLISRLAEEGKAVIIISSDLPELLSLCDRIGVMCDGRLGGILGREEASEERILSMATSERTPAHVG